MDDTPDTPRPLGARIWDWLSDMARSRRARPVVHLFTRIHTALYRWTGGRAQTPGFPTLLLSVVGRRSNTVRTVPLVYVEDGDTYIIAAAYSGADENPTWWINLRAAGAGTVRIGRTETPVTAAVVAAAERSRLWDALCRMYPPFTTYQSRTTREIPIVRLTPQR